MADKKITDLTELTTPDQNDLLVIVSSPAGTAITKKIRVSSLMTGAAYITTSSSQTGAGVRGTITSNAVMTSSGNVAGGEFSVTATATSSNTTYQYGIFGRSSLTGATANVKTEHAGGKLILDVGNAASLITNTYGLIVQVANTGIRAAQPTAFVSFAENPSANSSLSTKYLFDIGQNGVANVSANTSAGANSNVMLSNCTPTKTANHMVLFRINGQDMWLLASNVAPA